MNPLVLFFACGNVFFLGMSLTVVAAIMRSRTLGRIAGFLQAIVWLVGVSLVILSATPLPIWSYGVWLLSCAGQQFAGSIKPLIRFKKGLTVLLVVVSAAMCFSESSYRLSPSIAVSPKQPVYVIGDSISAGITDKERPWPGVLADLSDLKVTNLARPGATVESALKQADGIQGSNALVILEIGGNDLLGNTAGPTFYAQLEQLLAKVRKGNNQVVMFELPLFPLCNPLGRAQRILARKYNATLIPKTYLTKVFGLKDGTSDGLHLSQTGDDVLAILIFQSLKMSR